MPAEMNDHPISRRYRLPRMAIATLMVTASIIAISGCGSTGPDGIVPARGTITYHGGVWPKPGMLYFNPVPQPNAKFPTLPASASFDTNGSFTVKCVNGNGLVPGEYRVGVVCWKVVPDENIPGVSYVPKRFSNCAESGLTVTVEPGGKPIVVNWDIPKE